VQVFFDDDCGLCTRAMRWCSSRARGVVFLPADSAASSVVVVDAYGREHRSVRAVAMLLSVCGRPAARAGRLMSFPIFRPLFELLYLLVARNRRRISRLLGWDACPVRNAVSSDEAT